MTESDDLEARLRATLAEQADAVHPHVQPFDPSSGMHVGLDDTASGLPPVPGRGRSRRRVMVSAAAAAVLVVAGVAIAVNRNAPSTERVRAAGAPPGSGNEETPPTTVKTVVGIDSLDGLFVATSAEFNGPTFANSWLNFSTRAFRIGANRCLRAEGLPARGGDDLSAPRAGAMRDNTQFPDIEELKAGTFLEGTSSPTPPSPTVGDQTAPTTTVEDLSYAAAFGKCEKQAIAPYRQVVDDAHTYAGIWGQMWTKGTDRDPTVIAAKAGYVSCMAEKGITVTADGSDGELTDVFGLADEAQRNGDTARVAQLARAYGSCVEPVSEAMDDYRLAKRAEFYQRYGPQLQKLAVDIDRAETRLSAQYGIPRP